MSPAKLAAAEMLHLEDLRHFCASPGPCVTITLPAFHPGAQALPRATQLKAAVRKVQDELLQQLPAEQAEPLMAPVRELAEDPEMWTGGRDVVIFRSPGLFQQYHLPSTARFRAVAGRYFHIVPFLDQLSATREFFILGLNEKHTHLLHYADGVCEDVPLPRSVPKSVEEAGAFDVPDHTRRNHSAAGTSTGSMSAVSFGTGSEREKGNERLYQFFKLLDQKLAGLFKGQLLMLSGARRELALYRRAATYPRLFDSDLDKDLHALSTQQIASLAAQSAREHDRRKAEEQLRLFREMSGTGRTLAGIRPIVQAAGEGRVAKLLLAEDAEFGTTLEALESDSGEDLLNAAAVLSIRCGAEVLVLPASTLAQEAPVAALLRY